MLSLMARESFRHTFMAREPVGGRNELIKLTSTCLGSHRNKEKGRKTGFTPESGEGPKGHFHRVPTSNMLGTPRSVENVRSTREPVIGSWLSRDCQYAGNTIKEGQTGDRSKAGRKDRGL